jgi:hypothetical protein
VLTAASCIKNTPPKSLLTHVRLGEWDLKQEKDCEGLQQEILFCAPPTVDIPIEKIIPHENFDDVKKLNDIALLRLSKRVKRSDFVQLSCLPRLFPERDEKFQNDTVRKFKSF